MQAIRFFSNVRRWATRIALVAVLLVLGAQASVPKAHAAGTVSVCDLSHFTSALSGGGTVTFSCSGTITLTSKINITNNTTLDGVGQTVTLSGGGTTQMFEIASAITFNVQNITLANGYFVGGIGAAIYNNTGILHVANVTFSNNSTSVGGAIGSEGSSTTERATTTVTNSTFSGNSAVYNGIRPARGGAIFNGDYSTLTVTNSTFSGNSAPTLANNGGTWSGSSINNLDTATLKNTIIANGTASVVNCHNTGTLTDGGGNLEDRNDCGFSGTSKNSTNPLLGTLANYGGNTQTFPLLPGSPAIDAGVSATCSDAPVSGKDQRGVTRPSACDMGAFESQGFTLASPTGTPQSANINTAFAAPLGLTVTSAHSEPVNGGKVTFTPPGSGASAVITTSPATISSGAVSVTATANGTAGSYNVVASATGATSVNFALKNAIDTTTTLGSSPNPSIGGITVNITATISPSAATGTVTFQDSGTDITGCVNVSVSSGKATCATSALALGTHNSITAVYSGDAAYNSSTGTLSPGQQVNCQSAITVTNNADTGAGSLRQAIAGICAGGTITFGNDYTILLASELAISKNMTMDGAGHKITVSGNHATRVFNVTAGQVTFNRLTIADGNVQTTDCGSSTDKCGSGMILQSSSAIVTVTNSTFSGNSAKFGAGIYNEGTLTVTNSTFSGNSADYGGGVVNAGTLTMKNSTLSGNSATANGGGINSIGTLNLYNTILANNSSGSDCYKTGGALAGDHNLIETDSPGNPCGTTSPIHSDPNLAASLADNGGGTQTFALLSSSLAIDAANGANCSATDQRGQNRNDLACDIGAYEMVMTDRNNVSLTPSTTLTTTYGPARAGIKDNGSTPPGVITATKVTNWTGGTPPGTLGAWWELTAPTTTGLSLSLQLCYSDTEVGNLTESGAHFWRYNGSWNDAGAVASFSGATPNRCAQITGITDLSRWTLATGNPGNNPTAVTLSSFKATTPSFDLGVWLRKMLGQ